MKMLDLQIETCGSGWATIARGSGPEWITEQAELFQMRGFCMRIRDGRKVVREFFAEDHDDDPASPQT